MRRCIILLATLSKRNNTLKSRTKAATAAVLTSPTLLNKKNKGKEEEEEGEGKTEKGKSLSTTFPTYASLWVRATSNKLIQPQHIPYTSKKMAVWRCPSCAHQFKERVYLYVAAGGRCPSCGVKPSLDGTTTTTTTKTKNGGGLTRTKARRQRRDEEVEEKKNKEAKSIADSDYLVVSEKRNLQPMLAKNFEKEMRKINLQTETLFVSPKLDGIRCIVGYDKKQKTILFFSRAGTLFECCDAKIEPALRYIFEHVDPDLVLDGELYNSSENTRRMEMYFNATSKNKNNNNNGSAFATYYKELFETHQKESKKSSKEKLNHNKDKDNNGVIYFESLVSAIRTTREKRTPEVEQLQQLLQYHIFDVLYASHFPSCDGANVLFSERYAFLQSIMAKLHSHNKKHMKHYDMNVLQVVPSIALTTPNNNNKSNNKKEIISEEALTSQMESNIKMAMSFGYEGLMIRREANHHHNHNHHHKVANAKKAILRATTNKKNKKGDAPFGGYEHGKRSSCLLKYKKMQDAEFVIVSAVEGKGKWKGSLGAFVCEVPNASSSSSRHKNKSKNKNDSKLFYVTPATSEENKKKMWLQRKTYNGKALTVQYQDLSKEGIPRFPIGKCIRGAANGKDWL